jgi:hypothetical protein
MVGEMMEIMIRRIAPLALVISSVLIAKAPQEHVDVTSVQSANFTAGMTVRIGGTAGELNIEAWDQPRVEATLTRSEYVDAPDKDSAKKRLERIGLAVEKRGNDIAVELKAPHRHFWARWLRGKTNATLVCRVMVPRDAKLVVRHENGSVMVYGAGGDIDASARFGDILLQLADPGAYAIDARSKMGGVYTDYTGKYRGRMGERFVTPGSASAHKVKLRVGAGGIEIVKMGPLPAASGS